jgi:hypothetical protein
MLRIQRLSNGGVVFVLSGRLEADSTMEVRRLLESEANATGVSLDLRELTLIERDAVLFLAECEAKGISLKNCPAYIREWIAMGQQRKSKEPD